MLIIEIEGKEFSSTFFFRNAEKKLVGLIQEGSPTISKLNICAHD